MLREGGEDRSYCDDVGGYVPFFPHLLYSFDGRVVAKLPFTPISWFQGLSHRNLMGEDYTDCSFIFLYIICCMSVRQVSLPSTFPPSSPLSPDPFFPSSPSLYACQCLCYVCAVFVLCLCSVCAMFVQCLCYVCAMFVQCLCSVCAMFVLCLCSVCAVFVQCLCSVCAVSRVFLCLFLFMYCMFG